MKCTYKIIQTFEAKKLYERINDTIAYRVMILTTDVDYRTFAIALGQYECRLSLHVS